MKIMIDGYNLLKHFRPESDMGHEDRMWMFALLKRYAREKGHQVIVVFDGGLERWPVREYDEDHIMVIYAGQKQSADDFIVDWCESKQHRVQLVVTSDRLLTKKLSEYNVPTIPSDLFEEYVKRMSKVKQPSKPSGEVVKFDDQKDSEIDVLMRQGSRNVMMKEEDQAYIPDDITIAYQKNGLKLDKKVLLLLKKL